MGDRICLTFRWRDEESPVLYAHWDGMSLLTNAELFYGEYADKIRKEPSNWMVNFLNWLRDGRVVDGNYYLYNRGEECSPDDNGYWTFDLETGKYSGIADISEE